MDIGRPNLDQFATEFRAAYEPVFVAEASASGDISNLKSSGYNCIERLHVADGLEVWRAYSCHHRHDVAIVVRFSSPHVSSPDYAEMLLDKQAEAKTPIDRGGEGYQSFLVYPLAYGRTIGRRSSRWRIAAMASALVATSVVAFSCALWPESKGVIKVDQLDSKSVVHSSDSSADCYALDFSNSGDVVAWAEVSGDIWMRRDGESKLLGRIEGYATSFDLSLDGKSLLIVTRGKRLLLFDSSGTMRQLGEGGIQDAWLSSDGMSVYSRDGSNNLTRTSLTGGDARRTWRVGPHAIIPSPSDPDIFAVIGPEGITVLDGDLEIEFGHVEDCISFDRAGGVVVFGNRAGVLRIHSDQDIAVIQLPQPQAILVVAVADGAVYFSTSTGLYMVNLDNPEQIIHLTQGEEFILRHLAMSWDEQNRQLVAATTEGVVRWTSARLP